MELLIKRVSKLPVAINTAGCRLQHSASCFISIAMTLSKIYRAKAAALAAEAKSAAKPVYKERFERMALAYERLAEKYAMRLQLREREAQARRDHRRRG
jgi:hypothetical protein